MNRKSISSIILPLIVLSILPTTVASIPATDSLPVHNIDSGEDFATIQAAIDDSDTIDGHTILVDAGTYYENVVVNKTISLVGEHKETTIIDGNSTGTVVSITANDSNITRFTLQNSGLDYPSCACKLSSNGNNISHLIITNNYVGINVYSSSGNLIVENNITANGPIGILLESSHTNNTICRNNITDNTWGIHAYSSSGNLIVENNIAANEFGIYFDGSATHTICKNNITENGFGIRFHPHSTGNNIVENNIINNGGGMYIEAGSDGNYLSGNTIANNHGTGINICYSGRNFASGNVVANNTWGIILYEAWNTTLSDNTINGNEYGLCVEGEEYPSWMRYMVSIDTSNLVNGKPVYYFKNQKDLVINPATHPQVGYLALINSTNITVEGLTLKNNYQGLLLAFTNSSRITNNTMASNRRDIWMDSCSGMHISRNNFMDDPAVQPSGSNSWDDGYPAGGNYWSGYTGVDLYSGPDQDHLGPDGIGDTPYVIDGNNQDSYPLMKPCVRIEVGHYEAYRISDNVFGLINLTSMALSSNCSVEFRVMGPAGVQVYEEVQNVFLLADNETIVFFAWSSGQLPLGDYYTRFLVNNEIVCACTRMVFDSGWFSGFTVSEDVFVCDFQTLPPDTERRCWRDSPLELKRGETAVFNFSLSAWITDLKISVKASTGSDFIMEVGNAMFNQVSNMYILDNWSSIEIENVPAGTYDINLHTISNTAQLLNVSIRTSFEAYPMLKQTLKDEFSTVDKLQGLVGTNRTYTLIAGYCTNTTEQIAFSITNETSGSQIRRDIANATLFVLNNKIDFTFEYQFPSTETNSTLSFNLTLIESKESLVWSVPVISRRLEYQIELNYTTTAHYKMPSSIWAFGPRQEPTFQAVNSDELEALELTNVTIIDVGVQDDVLKNVTLSFRVRNKYFWHFLWWSAHVYYELFVSPVKVMGANITIPLSVVFYNETENIVVKGVPVVYRNGTPQVDFTVEFRKSTLWNIADWALKGLKIFLPRGLPVDDFGKVFMEIINAVSDFTSSTLDESDLQRILFSGVTAAFKCKLESDLTDIFKTCDLSEILGHINAYSFVLFVSDLEPGWYWRILWNTLNVVLEKFFEKPELLRKIIATAMLKVFSTSWTEPLGKISSVVRDVLIVLDVIDAVIDGVIKLIAPDGEKKDIIAGLNGPVIGDFQEVNLGDPLLSVWFSGSVSNSSMNTSRIYNMESFQLNASIASSGNASFTLDITPSINYTGAFISAFSDLNTRSSLLLYYGIVADYTDLLITNQSLIIQGNGTFLGSFEKIVLEIHTGSISGYLQQPFQTCMVNNTCYVDLPMTYPFGKNLTYTVQLELPPCSSNIQVSGSENYTILYPTVSWNTCIERILVQFTLLEGDVSGPLEDPEGSGIFPPDGNVDDHDLAFISQAYGKEEGDLDWEDYRTADFTGSIEDPPQSGQYPPDGIVDIYELTRFGKNYGETTGSSAATTFHRKTDYAPRIATFSLPILLAAIVYRILDSRVLMTNRKRRGSKKAPCKLANSTRR